ncbi:MAG: hypothetical protein VB070_06875 [Clostridiaceae bacterium]|nr:hypothetical protein [Clostridiaceae bacterium]
MAKLSKDFFIDNQVLIMGYPLKADPSMPMLLQAFLNNGIQVFAQNSEAKGDADIKVYAGLDELPQIPKTAYIYLEKGDIDAWIKPLAAAGITRILFHSKKDVDPRQLDECKKVGLETAVACPMMIFGKGIHWFHAKLAGVR